jgi:indole-3-glycerol phosphate synthase
VKASASRLEPIVRAVRQRHAERRAKLPGSELERSVRPDPGRRTRFLAALSGAELAFIAECKRRSPSVGALAEETDWKARAESYREGGAAALSVLTELDHFGGALEHLAEVESVGLPRLRKDFLIDPAMVLEAAAFGADAVLLLPCILADAQLGELHACARELGLAALVEVHEESELERALALEPELVGVNARDLSTFQVDLATVERILPRVPSGIVRVAESGIHGLEDLRRVRAAGADAALVGEALMRSADPAATLRAWREGLRG